MTRHLTRQNSGHRHVLYLPDTEDVEPPPSAPPPVSEPHLHAEYSETIHTHPPDLHDHDTDYAPSAHGHDTTHDHTGTYSPAAHDHQYAEPDHVHPGDDATHPDLASHVSIGLSADSHGHPHDHDGEYAAPHAHDFSPSGHTHTAEAHNHDATYSGTAHSHDTTHDHDGSYATPGHGHTSVDVGAAASDHTHDTTHNHDADYEPTHSHPYAGTSHTHAIADGDVPASIARDTEVSAAIATHAATPHGGEGGGFQFPVGAIYIERSGVNPGTTFGYGTWALFGVGRLLMGTDSQAGVEAGSTTHSHGFTQPDAHTGVINHQHTVSVNDPGHTHVQQRFPTATGGSTGFTVDTSMSGTPAAANTTASGTTGITASTANPAGGVASLSHSNGAVADGTNAPPSISAFMWERTA